MAEVNTDKGGKGGKNKQKKISLRVDFTPMVDMNMLLITFFMFCTSLTKPQTMEISMPSNDKEIADETRDKVKDSNAITIILGGKDQVYYYLGMPTAERYNDSNFLVQSNYSENGVRALLLKRNTNVNRQITELKTKLMNKEITEETYKERSAEIKKEGSKKDAPTVMIKPTSESTYANLVDALDEMQICNIGAYAILEMAQGDNYLMFTRTGNAIFKADLPMSK